MHARVLLSDGQLQVEVVLIVLEPDVESRPVVLDEVALEDQRLNLICAPHELEVVDAPHHLVDPRRLRVAGREVLTQAVAQAQGFADVDDLRFRVAEQVNAWIVRHRAQALFDCLFLLCCHREGL